MMRESGSREPVRQSRLGCAGLGKPGPAFSFMPYTVLETTSAWAPKVPFNPRARGQVTMQPLDPNRPDPYSIVAMLNSLADQYGRDPQVRAYAEAILGRFRTNNDNRRHWTTLANWVTRNIVFIADPVGGEYVRGPLVLLGTYEQTGHASGDCDDHCLILASLARSVGIRAGVAGVSLNGSPIPDHVINVVELDGVLIQTDTCAKMGQRPIYNQILLPEGWQ